MTEVYHVPVMVREVLTFLAPARGGVYFDGTLGGGGHTAAILDAGAEARVVAVDQDPEAIAVAQARLATYGDRVQFVQANFADAAEDGTEPLAGALLDLGISSRHIDAPERGFTFRSGTTLDMRMSGGGRTAADLLNSLSEAELADIFYYYGEERRSRRLARDVVNHRKTHPFHTSDDLLAAMERALGPRLEPQDKARIFQALRIAVNNELEVLERALPALRDRLEVEGVLVVLSYHSLEDRRVKDAFREWSRSCICPPEAIVCQCRGRALGETLTKKPMLASDEEVAANSRSRSAKLRAWRKAGDDDQRARRPDAARPSARKARAA
ncbi:MAG TPA: 16S rRNA (cytosine(1402)-N(4))-methyltransferase RsmH [Longimicrobiales bacterium]|nr:16S rRNA (cytosine(1402)-N(4))-methyltransferase RsmH [Longimicrobiales bacterium]